MSSSDDDLKTEMGLDIFHNYAATKTFKNMSEEQRFRQASAKLGRTNKEHYANAKSYRQNVSRYAPIATVFDDPTPLDIFINHDGSKLVVKSYKPKKDTYAKIHVFDMNTKKKLKTTEYMHYIRGIGYVTKTDEIIVCGETNVYSLEEGKKYSIGNYDNVQLFPRDTRGFIFQFLMSPNGEYFVREWEGSLNLYKTDGAKFILTCIDDFYGPGYRFSNDSKFLAVAHAKNIFIWNIQTKKLVFDIINEIAAYKQVLLTHDNKQLIVAIYKKISVWDIETSTCITSFESDYIADQFASCALDHTGHYLFASNSARILIYDIRTGEKIHELKLKDTVRKIVAVPNKPMFVVLYENYKLVLWDVGHMFFYQKTTGGKPKYTYKSKPYAIHIGARGGKYILVGKDRKKIYI